MSIFTGLSAFPITPANAQGQLDLDEFGTHLERLVAAKVDSIGVLGSTGTYAYLTEEQRTSVTRAATEAVGGRVPVLIGVGAMRSDMAVTLSQEAQTAGADGIFMAPVNYTPLTRSELVTHYHAVAQATDLPLVIYNNPSTTHTTFAHDLIVELAAHPQIAAIKMPIPSDGDFASEIRSLKRDLPADFALGYSGDWELLPAMLAGADLFFSAVGGMLPKPLLALTRAAASGDIKQAETINAQLMPLWDICRSHGSLRVIYAVGEILSLSKAVLPAPLLPLAPADKENVAKALEHLEV